MAKNTERRNLKDQVAIITGGAKGIGKAISCSLAREGVKIVILDILPLEDTINYISNNYQVHCLGLKCDVTDYKQVKNAVGEVINNFKKIDILICNAGVFGNTKFEEIDEKEWDKVFSVNIKSYFLCTQAVFPFMKEQGYGKIIYMGSSAGKNGGLLAGPHYVASKGAVHAFVKWIAKYGGRFGIYANAIAPGPVKTDLIKGQPFHDDMFPLGRLGEPEDIAEAAVFLASQESNWISGEVLDVNGGIL